MTVLGLPRQLEQADENVAELATEPHRMDNQEVRRQLHSSGALANL